MGQQVRPPAVGEVLDSVHAFSRCMASAISERINAALDMREPERESSHWSCSTGSSREMAFLRGFGMVAILVWHGYHTIHDASTQRAAH